MSTMLKLNAVAVKHLPEMGPIGIPASEPPSVCSDKKCPFHGSLSVRGQTLVGTVASTDMQKTVVVEREYDVQVPKYDRQMKRRSRIPAHQSPCLELHVGDEVKIAETRRLSKTKSHVVVEKLQDNEQDIVTTKKEEESVKVSIHGRDMYSFVEYDNFYGLYWNSEIQLGEFFAQLITLADNLSSTAVPDGESASTEERVLDGVIVQDFTNEINMSQNDNRELFEVGDLWADLSNSEFNERISQFITEIDPDVQITYIRVNTPYFNCSWELTERGSQIGMLTHHVINEELFNFLTATIESTELQEQQARKSLKNELETMTGEYQQI